MKTKYRVGDMFVSFTGCMMYIVECIDDVLGLRYKVHYLEPTKKEYDYTYSSLSLEAMVQKNTGWTYYPVVK